MMPIKYQIEETRKKFIGELKHYLYGLQANILYVINGL